MDDQKLTDALKLLVERGKDREAYAAFQEYFFKTPLVSGTDDSRLASVSVPVGFGVLHARSEWEREVGWWDSVIQTIKDYERRENVRLHKGLPLHNRVLPLLELQQMKQAKDSLEEAIQEDICSFGLENSYSMPGYKLGCFLIPIANLVGQEWLEEEEKRALVDIFEVLFLKRGGFVLNKATDYFSRLNDSRLRGVLETRFGLLEKYLNIDPVMVAVYCGSIVEGVLTDILCGDPQKAAEAYREIASGNPRFVFSRCDISDASRGLMLDYYAPVNKDPIVVLDRLRKWGMNQKIEVAQKAGVFEGKSRKAIFILCHLLRDYRNLVHPTNYDQLGREEWKISFNLNADVARMLKTALEIVLTYLSIGESFGPKVAGDPKIQKDGVYTNVSGYSSLASPSRQKNFTGGVPTHTIVSPEQGDRATVMGSSTSTTTS